MSGQKPTTRATDPLIDEIREIRREIAEQFDNDIHKLCDHLRQLEQCHGDRLIRPDKDGNNECRHGS
ncbi:MAG: hypothetical protein HOP29_14005 [Phycisphaerales bacterium]|nr:hypothetical protein [Phycisphaerales bacterium]